MTDRPTALPVDPRVKPGIDPPVTVASLLDDSHAAHLRYREALPVPASHAPGNVLPGDAEAALRALQEADTARREALALDPEQNDPAWQQESYTFDHAALVTFYGEQLARARAQRGQAR